MAPRRLGPAIQEQADEANDLERAMLATVLVGVFAQLELRVLRRQPGAFGQSAKRPRSIIYLRPLRPNAQAICAYR